MSDLETGKAVLKRINKVNRLRDELDKEFGFLIRAMSEDGQPDYELMDVGEMRTTLGRACHRDLLLMEADWEGFVRERRRQNR